MSISNTTYQVVDTGDGTTVTFTFPFKIFFATDLMVYVNNVLQAITTNYTVAFTSGSEGGSVTFILPPGAALSVLIERIEPFTQTLTIPTEGPLPALAISNALDLLTMLCIQINGVVQNTVGPAGPQGPAGPAGPIASVTSANGDISVANPTSAPVLTLNSGTGDNQIVKLTAAGKLPAVDGSLLTNLPVNPFSSQNVVTGSRSLATVYHNTTGKIMFVNIVINPSAAVNAYTDSSNPPTTAVSYLGSAVTGTLSFMVLSGNYYEVISAGSTINSWTEWY